MKVCPNTLYTLNHTVTYVKAEGTDVDYCVYYDSTLQSTVVSFQGSHDLSDWMQDLQYKPQRVNVLGVDFHSGFAEAWESCNAEVMNKIWETYNNHRNCRVMLIGHSYGGALATIFAIQVNNEIGIHPILITFGMPRVCGTQSDSNFVKSVIDKRSVAFQNGSDIVPNIPTNLKPLTCLTHVGESYNIVLTSQTFTGKNYHHGYGEESIYNDYKIEW